MAKHGICWLCGQETYQLTADHIQPQCAFNEKNRKHVRLASVIGINTCTKLRPCA
jgi:hypothetical protein